MADHLCEICGQSMPEGESMFKFHGYSGNCPTPPQQKRAFGHVAEYFKVDRADHTFWIEVHLDRAKYADLGPFASDTERDSALDDLMAIVRSTGGVDSVVQ
jgi:hypothetical protein